MADIIHLSGPDGAGKSTLVKALTDKLGWDSIHFDKPKDLQDGKNQYFSFLKNLSKNVIADRLHDGEWIYAPLYRGYTGDYLNEFEIELVKQGHNYLFVFVKAELEELIRRTRIRGEDFVKEEHFQTVLDLFEDYLLAQQMPWIEIDTTNSKTEDNVCKILESRDNVFKIWNQVRGCTKGCTGIFDPTYPRGNVNAEYMIVGQNPGGQDKRDHGVAFGDGPAADFLMKVLKEAGILRNSWITNLALCPSYDNKIKRTYAENCASHLQTQLDIIKPKEIFVLGGDTSKFIDSKVRENYKVVELEHPAYVRRFKAKDYQYYIDQFKRG